MSEVSIRDLRNQGGRILDRVLEGERLTITRDGRPVACLSPLPRQPLPGGTLLERWRRLPRVDAERWRADIDQTLDGSV